jgi:hypothetical protein
MDRPRASGTERLMDFVGGKARRRQHPRTRSHAPTSDLEPNNLRLVFGVRTGPRAGRGKADGPSGGRLRPLPRARRSNPRASGEAHAWCIGGSDCDRCAGVRRPSRLDVGARPLEIIRSWPWARRRGQRLAERHRPASPRQAGLRGGALERPRGASARLPANPAPRRSLERRSKLLSFKTTPDLAPIFVEPAWGARSQRRQRGGHRRTLADATPTCPSALTARRRWRTRIVDPRLRQARWAVYSSSRGSTHVRSERLVLLHPVPYAARASTTPSHRRCLRRSTGEAATSVFMTSWPCGGDSVQGA